MSSMRYQDLKDVNPSHAQLIKIYLSFLVPLLLDTSLKQKIDESIMSISRASAYCMKFVFKKIRWVIVFISPYLLQDIKKMIGNLKVQLLVR